MKIYRKQCYNMKIYECSIKHHTPGKCKIKTKYRIKIYNTMTRYENKI